MWSICRKWKTQSSHNIKYKINGKNFSRYTYINVENWVYIHKKIKGHANFQKIIVTMICSFNNVLLPLLKYENLRSRIQGWNEWAIWTPLFYHSNSMTLIAQDWNKRAVWTLLFYHSNSITLITHDWNKKTNYYFTI